jgi:hypothetical protein
MQRHPHATTLGYAAAMHHRQIVPAVALAALSVAAAPATRPAATRPADPAAAESRARQVGLACLMYINEHRGMGPADLGEVLRFVGPSAAKVFVLPGEEPALAPLPDVATAEWVNAHTSWAYLGKDVKWSKVHRPWETVLLHSKLDAPLTEGAGKRVVVVAYMDGHVVAMPVEQARAQVDASTKALLDARVPAKP